MTNHTYPALIAPVASLVTANAQVITEAGTLIVQVIIAITALLALFRKKS
jgi:hypothetical protein